MSPLLVVTTASSWPFLNNVKQLIRPGFLSVLLILMMLPACVLVYLQAVYHLAGVIWQRYQASSPSHSLALTGSLPASWAGKGLFPSLASMALGANRAGRLSCISGPMLAEWATPFSFQVLEILALRTCFASEHAWHQLLQDLGLLACFCCL